MDLKALEKEFAKLGRKNEKFSRWEKKLNKLIKDGKLISLKVFEITNNSPIDWYAIGLVMSLGTFTLRNNHESFERVLNQMIDNKIITSFERKKLGYKLIDKDNDEIRFLRLSDFVPTLNGELKTSLESEDRSGHCHWDSIGLSKALNIENDLVSGFCSVQSKKMPYPHSWLEIKYKGKDWVLDFTLNEMMNKEAYYKLHNPQKTVRIDKQTLIEDMEMRSKTVLGDKDIRMYLFYPETARKIMQEEYSKRKSYKEGKYPWIMIEE